MSAPYPDTVTVPVSYVRNLLRAVEEQGHDADALLTEAGVESLDFDSDRGFPAATFGYLYQRAIWLLKDESLGVVSGGRVPSGTFRMLCLCVIHCATLGDVIRRAAEFLDVCQGAVVKPVLYHSETSGSSELGSGRVALGFALRDEVSDQSLDDVLRSEGPLRVRTSLLMWLNLMGWFAGKSLPVSGVTFDFDAPTRQASRWSDLFGCPVHFGEIRCALEFPIEVLSLANVQTEASLDLFLKTVPYRLLIPGGSGETWRERVLAVIGDDYSQRLPDSVEVASRLHLSVSTLRRHLNAENTSFQLLKDEGRRAAALRYLSGSELSMTDIASLVGFDDPSAFFRAFRRWTGMTPTAYRRESKDKPAMPL